MSAVPQAPDTRGGRARLPYGLNFCHEQLARQIEPRQSLTVSQWADTHRELTSKQSGEHGHWRTDRTPYLRELMDCLSVDSPVRDIVVMKSSQVGVTEAVVNFLGYVMHHAPAPTMVLMPSLELRDAWKTQKLNPLFTDTPAVRDLMGGLRVRDAAHRADVIDFPGGVLFLAGGNSPNSYAQRSARNLVLDDLDRFPPEVGEEGDPVELAKGRTKAFRRAKRIFISTPTAADTSLIARLWAGSDQRVWHAPCPHCTSLIAFEWDDKHLLPGAQHQGGRLMYSEQVDAAWYVCGVCGATIGEHHKPRMNAHGRWLPQQPGRHVVGFHYSALFGALGLAPSWLDLARGYVEAIKATGTYKTFVNTQLGLPHKEQGEEVHAVGLITRREDYPEPLPGILARTAGVDVQKDRLEVSVADWGEGEECWLHDHLILPGDTAQPEVWAELHEALQDVQAHAACIDSGFNTSMVYTAVKGRAWLAATKGMPGPGKPFVEDDRARKQRLRKGGKPRPFEPIGVDQGKALLLSRLRLIKPGPGYIHFPQSAAFDDEYFEQLTAEKLVTKMRGGRPMYEWVQKRPRNEALDCWLLALAALRLPLRQSGAPRARRVYSQGVNAL